MTEWSKERKEIHGAFMRKWWAEHNEYRKQRSIDVCERWKTPEHRDKMDKVYERMRKTGGYDKVKAAAAKLMRSHREDPEFVKRINELASEAMKTKWAENPDELIKAIIDGRISAAVEKGKAVNDNLTKTVMAYIALYEARLNRNLTVEEKLQIDDAVKIKYGLIVEKSDAAK